MRNVIYLTTDTTLQAGLEAIKNKISAWIGRVNTALSVKGVTPTSALAEIPQRIQQINNIRMAKVELTLTSDANSITFPNPLGVKPKAFFLKTIGASSASYRFICGVRNFGGGKAGATITANTNRNGYYYEETVKPESIGVRQFYMDEEVIMVGKPGTDTRVSVVFESGVTYELTIYCWEEYDAL